MQAQYQPILTFGNIKKHELLLNILLDYVYKYLKEIFNIQPQNILNEEKKFKEQFFSKIKQMDSELLLENLVILCKHPDYLKELQLFTKSNFLSQFKTHYQQSLIKDDDCFLFIDFNDIEIYNFINDLIIYYKHPDPTKLLSTTQLSISINQKKYIISTESEILKQINLIRTSRPISGQATKLKELEHKLKKPQNFKPQMYFCIIENINSVFKVIGTNNLFFAKNFCYFVKDLEEKDESGNNIFHKLIISNYDAKIIHIFRHLFEFNTTLAEKLITTKNNDGNFPLTLALKEKDSILLPLIFDYIKKYKNWDPNYMDQLIFAIELDNPYIIEKILEKLPNFDEKNTIKFVTYTIRKNQIKLAAKLTEFGYTIPEEEILESSKVLLEKLFANDDESASLEAIRNLKDYLKIDFKKILNIHIFNYLIQKNKFKILSKLTEFGYTIPEEEILESSKVLLEKLFANDDESASLEAIRNLKDYLKIDFNKIKIQDQSVMKYALTQNKYQTVATLSQFGIKIDENYLPKKTLLVKKCLSGFCDGDKNFSKLDSKTKKVIEYFYKKNKILKFPRQQNIEV